MEDKTNFSRRLHINAQTFSARIYAFCRKTTGGRIRYPRYFTKASA